MKMPKTARTPKKIKLFLEALCEFGNVTLAAKSAGLNRQTLYGMRAEDSEFAKAWAEAAEIGVAALEDEARRRAFDGWDEPVWYQGEQSGVVRKYSDTLLIFLLKGHKPEKYRENQRVDHTSSDGSMTPAPVALNISFTSKGADDECTVDSVSPEI